MSRKLVESHIREGGYGKAFGVSVAGHLLLVLFFVFGVRFFPAGDVLVIGTGVGGGQGDFVQVGLVADLGGGEGMYKPALTPRPTAAPAPPPEPTPAPAPAEEPQPEEDVFVEQAKPQRRTPPRDSADREREEERPTRAAVRQSAARAETSQETPPGAVPREPEPGAGGPGGAAPGSGGGMGSGRGLQVGTGSGEVGVESWYVRQVEQRVGQNWLRSALGQVPEPVQTVISFQIRPSGQIVNIRIEESSGISRVDLAAERAIRASTPLPELPWELRHRTVRFVAYFEYPHR